MPSIASDELPHHLGVLGVAEVEAVDEPDRAGPDAGQVHDRLGHHERRAPARVEGAPAVVAVGGEREAPAGVDAGGGVLQPQHGGVAARALDGVEEQLVVVLAEHPGGVGQQREQVGADVERCRRHGPIGAAARPGRRRRRGRSYSGASSSSELAGMSASTSPSRRSRTRKRPVPVTVPITEARTSHFAQIGEHVVEVLGLDDGQHPLLALARHHLEGLHARPRGRGPRTGRRPCRRRPSTTSRWWRR